MVPAIPRSEWMLDPALSFLNHGSFGATPRVLLEKQHMLQNEMEAEPVRFLEREIFTRLAEARRRLAAFVGARTEDLVFVPNATTAVNAVLRSFPLKSGDRVLVTDHAHNACRNTAGFVCAQSGGEVTVAKVPFPIRSSDEVVDALLSAVTTRTRLAVIEHVTSPTALVFPVERLVQELESRGVHTLVDGAHAPGMLPLQIDRLGASFYTGNCHKWMCAPKGAALLWVRQDMQESVRPLAISHGATSPRPGASRYEVEFSWTGTDDPSAYLSVPSAIDHFASALPGGWNALRARNRSLALAARDLLCAALEIEHPAPDDMIGALVSVPLPLTAGEFRPDVLQRTLFEAHRIEVPVIHWPKPPHRLLRVSAQAYNSLAEYEALAAVLREKVRNTL